MEGLAQTSLALLELYQSAALERCRSQSFNPEPQATADARENAHPAYACDSGLSDATIRHHKTILTAFEFKKIRRAKRRE